MVAFQKAFCSYRSSFEKLCFVKGHRSKSCNRLPAHIRQELDPVALTPQETTFSAFTLPRANQRRARSEGRPTPTFSTAPSHGHFADSIIDHTDFLSPNSLATDICFKRYDRFVLFEQSTDLRRIQFFPKKW